MKNFLIIAHWQCVIQHIDLEKQTFNADVKEIPLDKKKQRLEKREMSDGWCEFDMSTVDKKELSEVSLGRIFDWYIGYKLNPYGKRCDVSKLVFGKKYGKKGKRINMKEVERRAKQYFNNIKWY